MLDAKTRISSSYRRFFFRFYHNSNSSRFGDSRFHIRQLCLYITSFFSGIDPWINNNLFDIDICKGKALRGCGGLRRLAC